MLNLSDSLFTYQVKGSSRLFIIITAIIIGIICVEAEAVTAPKFPTRVPRLESNVLNFEPRLVADLSAFSVAFCKPAVDVAVFAAASKLDQLMLTTVLVYIIMDGVRYL
jgi:hypothetical protein